MFSYLFFNLFSILTTVLSIVSTAFMAYSFFTVVRQWNKKDNQDLFNLLIISSLVLIVIRIIDLIVKKIGYYYFRPVLSIFLILIAILGPVIIYLIAKSSGDTIYEDTYFSKLSDSEFLKAELSSSFGLMMAELEKISSMINSGESKQKASQGQGAAAYKHTEDPGDYKGMLKENRSLLLFLLLILITCGIYSLYFVHTASRDANIACAVDGEHTAGLLKYLILSLITCGIYAIYWDYALANRLAANGPRYGYTIQENGSTYLLWYLLGGWVCGLGFIVARNIVLKNLNKVCRGYNQKNPLF